ncbi:MAG: PEP-CTERM sorting domain-containing protein [Burkholderiaceae bacterium]|nr:PEP-CTERM sorting domain-containing protein [Burkholderiaceae bacterium]
MNKTLSKAVLTIVFSLVSLSANAEYNLTTICFGCGGPPQPLNDSYMTNLGTLGGAWREGYGVSASGQIVGQSATVDGYGHAAIWNGSSPTALDTLGGLASGAYSINAEGIIVGFSFAPANTTQHAVIWKNGAITDLNNLLSPSAVNAGWFLAHAYSINNDGVISGEATNSLQGLTSYVLLSPVPEADTSAMLLMGAGVMGFMARRRKQVAA